MFVIESRFQFIRHFVGNKQVADAVAKDLINREECTNPEYIETVECDSGVWDPGGPLWLSDKTHVFDLGETKIELYLYHLPYFVQDVSRATQREYDGVKYHKIHSGYMSCFCVTPEEFQTLTNLIKDPALKFAADAEEKLRQQLISQVFVPVAETKDDEGHEAIAVLDPKSEILN